MRIVAKIQGIAPSDWLTSRTRVAAQAISIGIDAAGKGAQQDIRAMIRAAGMGQRLGNAVRQSTFPKAPRVSMRAASELSASGNAADIIEAFSEGASAVSCASYVYSTVPAWAAEARAFVAWRDAVYLAAFGTMAEVQQGASAPGIAALLAGLPVLDWPT